MVIGTVVVLALFSEMRDSRVLVFSGGRCLKVRIERSWVVT